MGGHRPLAAAALAAILLAVAPAALALDPIGIEADAPVGRAATAVPASPPLPGAPRGPILVDGDAQLTAENGVRGGAGTADDPYVISDWTILHALSPAIHVRNTSAHVRLERLTIAGAGFVGSSEGLFLEGAANVTARNLTMSGVSRGLWIQSSARVVVEEVTYDDVVGVGFAINVFRSEDVILRRIVAPRAAEPAFVARSDRVTIEDSFLRGTDSDFGNSFYLDNSRHVTIRRVHVENTHPRIGVLNGGPVRDVAILDSAFVEPRGDGLSQPHAWAPHEDMLICGSRFEGSPGWGLAIFGMRNLTLLGNTVAGNAGAARLSVEGTLRVERNEFSGSTARGVWGGGWASTFRNNSFAGNAGEHWIGYTADARGNWWGDSSGPGGAGPGSGDRLRAPAPAVDPWLAAAPDLAVDCGTELEAWR